MNGAVSGIYKITNQINNHSYVGQSVDMFNRWAYHKSEGKNNNYDFPLYRAIKKYGIDNFDFQILEFVDRNNLTARETFWYEDINSEYNQIEPRFQNAKGKPIYQINPDTYKIIKQFKTTSDASRHLKIRRSNIWKVANGINGKAGGYYWCYVENYDNWSPVITNPPNVKKPVIQYDLQGNELNRFNSIKEASKETGVAAKNISKVVTGRNKTTGGYIWKYKERDVDE